MHFLDIIIIILTVIINRLSWANHSDSICSYLDYAKYSARILTIGFHRRDAQLWIVTDDSTIHRLSPLKTMNNDENMIRWNYENIVSVQIEENLNNSDRIILVSRNWNDYFLLIRNGYNNITVFDLNKQLPIWHIDQISFEWRMFMNGEIIMNMNDDRFIIIERQTSDTYVFYLFLIKIESSSPPLPAIILVKEGLIQCSNNSTTFCQMLSKTIRMNFFDGNQWNFVDQNGRLYQIDNHYFNDESLSNMANIDSIRNDIGSLYEYFECNKSGNSKKTIVIALSIAICMQLIILTILFAWCFWCRKRRKKLQKNIQNKQQWSLRGSISTSNGFKSRRNRFPLEMIRKKPPPRHSPFQSFSTVDEGSTQQTLASKLAEFDSLTAGETFGEISEKSSVSKSIKKKITAARSAKKAKLTEIVDEPIKTMAITLSDYFGKKPTAAIKKKTITTTSERRTPSPADSRSRKRKRSLDSIPREIQKDRKTEARTKQKRREQQLIKVIKLLAKDSDDYRQHRRRLLGHNEHGDNDDDDDDSRRARTTTRQARTITRSMEATDPQVIRDLLDNLDRHRERKRQRRRQH